MAVGRGGTTGRSAKNSFDTERTGVLRSGPGLPVRWFGPGTDTFSTAAMAAQASGGRAGRGHPGQRAASRASPLLAERSQTGSSLFGRAPRF